MGLFGLGKKDKVLDLTEGYRKQQEKAVEIKQDMQQSQQDVANPFAFFGNTDTSSSEVSEVVDVSSGEDKKRKLAKRLVNMTEKLEDLSNQIYHLQQRLEVLERKSGVGRY